MKITMIQRIFCCLLLTSPVLPAGKKEGEKKAKEPEKKVAKEKIREIKLKEQKLTEQIFQATNEFRSKKKLPALAFNSELAAIAREHSKKMAHHKIFSHADFEIRIKKLSKPIKSAAENLFKATPRKELSLACVNAWRKSPGHRKNLLGNYTDVGVGAYYGNDGFWYFTQIFASF